MSMDTKQFAVPEMMCGSCVASITRSVQQREAAATIDADLDTKVVRITSSLSEADLLALLDDTGFDATVAE